MATKTVESRLNKRFSFEFHSKEKPTFENKEDHLIIEQRNVYRDIHLQSLFLLNRNITKFEIISLLLPRSFDLTTK